MTQGTCLGYEIASEVGFRLLRSGEGSPLEIGWSETPAREPGEPVIRWGPEAGDPFAARLYREGSQYRLWIEDEWYSVEPDRHRIDIPRHGDPIRTEERLWGLPTILTLLADGDISLHASASEVGGRAALFCGPSRHGKTTLAVALQLAGHRMLSGDLVRVGSTTAPMHVYPGPAGLRVRRDTAESADLGWPVVAEDDDRLHLLQPLDARGTAAPVEIGAIFLLKGESDDLSVEPVDPVSAIPDLWYLSFHLPDDDGLARSMTALSALVDHVPVFDVRRPFDFRVLDESVAAIVDVVADA